MFYEFYKVRIFYGGEMKMKFGIERKKEKKMCKYMKVKWSFVLYEEKKNYRIN